MSGVKGTLFFEVIEVVVDDGLRQEIAIDLVASGLKVAYPVHHDHSCCGAMFKISARQIPNQNKAKYPNINTPFFQKKYSK